MIKFCFILVSMVLFFCSCEEMKDYQEYKPLKVSGWDLHDTLKFQFDVTDIKPKYNLYLNVRHRDAFEFQNFYIKIFTKMPDGTQKVDIVSMYLSEEDGTWKGLCSGDVCMYSTLIFSRFRFEQAGTYQIMIKHEMRQNQLKNLLDLGLKLEKAPPLVKQETE